MRLWLPAFLSMLSPACAGDLAFVTSQNADAVTVIDLNSMEIIASTELPGAPAPVAYDPKGAQAYVIAADSGRLSVLNEVGQITRHAELGAGAFGIAAIPGKGVVITDWYNNRLIRLDGDLEPLWTARTGQIPSGVAISANGALVATADRDDGTVSIFDIETGKLLRKITTSGEHPFAVTFHRGRLYSADVLGDRVSVMDPDSGTLLGHVATGHRPYGIAFAGGRGFVTNQYASTVTVFDPESLEVTETVEVGDYPEGIASLPDGSGVVLANWDSDTIMVLDARDLTITAELDVPAGPRAFGQFTGRQVQP